MLPEIESNAPEVNECTRWLKNPITRRTALLRPLAEIHVKPFWGSRRKICLRHTLYSFGSQADCSVRIDDPYLSSQHAEIRWNEAGFYEIIDLTSRNGTFLNGQAVLRAPLAAQGQIMIGRSLLSWGQDLALGQELDGFVATDEITRALVKSVRQAAGSSLPVLFLGETGTGKDELARMVHRFSDRSSAPFVAVNAATLGGGLVDSELFGHRKGAFTGAESHRLGAIARAHRGVLFLDEIGDLPKDTQAKLLRTLESGEVRAVGADLPSQVDFRLVAATSRNLLDQVKKGSFRADLFYRVSGFLLQVPPLRKRREDILPLARAFLEGAVQEIGEESLCLLRGHSWPGNIRELKAAIQRASCRALSDNRKNILPEDLDLNFELEAPEDQHSPRSLESIEKEAIQKALLRHGWARVMVAEELGIARSTLYEKMKKYRLGDSTDDQK